ncbi:MAG: hypothetical protein D6798_09360 [Deltaproteobacteria bacterium]|nr:MAG: hypothetical protein D6798_09360 [Deltaproteobacteria bacterium]
MAPRQLSDGYHLSLSIGKALWDDLVGAALPLKVAEGEYDLGPLVYKQIKSLQVREKVVALLEDRQPPELVTRARRRAADVWMRRREQVYRTIGDILSVQGDWKLEIDKEGTEFHYADQKIGVDAHVKATVHGTARLLKSNLELPFTLEKRLGATCYLGDIHYDKDMRAVVGAVQDPGVDLGDHVVLRMLNRAAALVLEQQTERFSNIPILKKDQLEELVAPAGGPLKLQMGVDDVAIEVTEENLTLRVRFGFQQLQLTG